METDFARSSLGPYCMTTCKAKCCKRGKLNVEDASAFSHPIRRHDGSFEIDITGGCEHLKNNMCSIYEKRPRLCKDYPIFTLATTILIASNCEGFQKGLLDDYIESAKKKGLNVKII